MRWGIVVQRSIFAASAVSVLATILGCMSLNIGGRNGTITNEDGSSDCGRLTVPANQEMDVYYPAPFASPPNLTVDSTWNDTVLVSQHADHFRIRNPEGSSREVTWKARGVRVPAATPVAVPVATVDLPTTPVATKP